MAFTISFLKLFFWALSLLSPILVLLTIIIISLGQVVCHLENWKRFDGLYWSLITATTVGYGDLRPKHKLSKIFSVIIAITGIIFTGIILSAALKAVSISFEKHNDTAHMEKHIEKML